MADKDLSRSIKIYIDGTPAAEGIAPLEQSISKLENKLAKLNKTEANYQQESEKLKKQLDGKHRTLQNYKKKVEETDRVLKNLSGATYKELLAVHKQVKEQLQNAVPGTEKYTAALEQNRRVTEAMVKAQREMRVEVGCQGTPLGRLADGINKYAGLITTTVAGVTGLTMTIRKSVNDYAQMAEAEAQVMKYTGMTKEEVSELNEEFKKMDTRTSREKLNGLAADAGRLGIEGKEAILEFVDIADKINVALGEDLGEEAVSNIGKLAKMFGENERLGLRGAMNATASAVNTVGQKSSAAESYIVDFTARVAGAGHQAGISQTQIIGLAASMDENMLRNETAATAYQKIVMKLFSDTDKFAKAAGLDLKEFGKLVREDANEALLTFAEALGQKGGLADLAPIFGDLQTEGAGVSSLLSVMASNADEIRASQTLANQAYQEGVSVLQEYEVQNNTVQAGLDKAKKGFLDVSIQLGEKLLPLMSSMVSGAGLLVRVLNAVISICMKYSGTLITLSAYLGGYILLMQAEVLWSKAVALWNGRVLTSYKKLYATIAKHPYAALFVVFTTLLAYLRDVSRATDDATRRQKMLNDVMGAAAAEAKSEKQNLEALLKVARDKSLSDDERRRAIEKINEISPEYLGNLTLENINTTDADTAIKKYTASILANAKAKAINAKLDELERQKQDLRSNPEEASRWYDPLTAGATTALNLLERVKNTAQTLLSTGSFSGWYEQTIAQQEDYAMNSLEAWIKRYDSEMNRIAEDQKRLQEELQKVMTEAVSDTVEPKKNGDGGGSPTTDTPTTDPLKAKQEALKQAIAAENALYEQQRADLKRTYIEGLDENLDSYALYSEAQEQLEIAHLHRTLEIAGLDADARRKIEEQLLDFKLKCMKEAENEQAKSNKKQTTQSKKATDDVKRQYESQFTTIKGYADQFGAALGEVIIGQTSALEALGGVMIDVVFDVLDQTINAWLTRLAAAAAVATAEGSMKEIASKGLFGIATSAAIAAAVSGLLATAKSALKGLLSKGRKGKSPSASADASSSTTPTGSRIPTGSVIQHASGRYDVIGAEDNRIYRGIPYIGESPTGIVRSPALISENGAELIVNTDDLRRLQQHINYPLVMQAISDSRRGTTVPQHASGTTQRVMEGMDTLAGGAQGTVITPDLIVRLTNVIASLEANGVDASVSLSDFEKKQNLRNRSRRIGSK